MGKGDRLLFLLILHFHSFSFLPCHSHLLYCLLYLSSPFSGRRHKVAHKGWLVFKPQLNQSYWSVQINIIPFLYFSTIVYYLIHKAKQLLKMTHTIVAQIQSKPIHQKKKQKKKTFYTVDNLANWSLYVKIRLNYIENAHTPVNVNCFGSL